MSNQPCVHPVDPDMDLPDGQTCAGCLHIKFCRSFIGRKGDETKCDWAPSRFAWPAPKIGGPTT